MKNQSAVSSLCDNSKGPSVASVEAGRNKNPEGRAYTASPGVTTTPSIATLPVSSQPVGSTVEGINL